MAVLADANWVHGQTFGGHRYPDTGRKQTTHAEWDGLAGVAHHLSEQVAGLRSVGGPRRGIIGCVVVKAIVVAILVMVGGIVLTIVAGAGPLAACTPDPDQAQMNCAPSNLIWVGIAAIIIGALSLAGIPAWASRSAGKNGALLSRLQQTGVPGSAQILSAAETGLTVNDAPQVDLVLAVAVAGRPLYQIRRRESVPRLAVGRLTDGRPLRVLVNAQQPDQMAIDWLADS